MVLLLLIFLSSAAGSCIFDTVKPNISEVPLKFISYSHRSAQRKREVTATFQPIRIHVSFQKLDIELSEEEEERVREVVLESVVQVQDILSVIPVEGSLILARSSKACKRTYASGVNKGKCALADPSYSGETCLDGFSIPDEHLEGAYVYDDRNPQPIRTLRTEGTGVQNVDYILYVTSSTTATCLTPGSSVIATATYCQLDQNGRPISGYINFCPSSIRPPDYSYEKAAKTSLHELFHALGFSTDLFPKYLRCTDTENGQSCNPHVDVINEVLSAERMVTPSVVSATSAHFDCSTHQTTNEFGPIMQTSANGKVQSHWDAAFMYGSLMTPTIGMPHLTILDNITLAAFADMGWYEVNFEAASNFRWGKGGGCEFALNPECEIDNEYFCSGNGSGCHHSLLDKATCSTNTFLHKCNVYIADAMGSCLENRENLDEEALASGGEIYSQESRCFLSSLSSNTVKISLRLCYNTVWFYQSAALDFAGRCYEHKCDDENLFVKIGKMDWLLCPWESELHQIPGYSGIVRCPPKSSLCHPERKTTTSSSVAPERTTSPSMIDTDDTVFTVRITFPSTSLRSLKSLKLESAFMKEVFVVIVNVASVAEERIKNMQLEPGSILFLFDLLPPVYTDDGPSSNQVLATLQNSIALDLFNFTLNDNIFAASSIKSWIRTEEAESRPFPPGGIAGVVIASIVCCVILGLTIYFLHRYYTTHTRVIANRVRPLSTYYAPSASTVSPPHAEIEYSLPHQPEDIISPQSRQSSLSQESSFDLQRSRRSSGALSTRDVTLLGSSHSLHKPRNRTPSRGSDL